jgi:hypothetical protein
MNYLTTLLTLATLLSTQAATSSLVGGVRVSTDTTGTNTIAANVVITNLNGGASRTALMARDVQVTNAVKVLSLTGNRVVGIGTDKALTNTTVSIATLEALSTAGTNNWINSGTTNSTLAGTAYPWAVEVTNHVNVGASGESGVILFTSTNGTYTASISLLADGTLVVTNNGVLVATIALVSGHDGSTNKFLSAAGTYLTAAGVNPTDNYIPVNSSGVFIDGPLHMNTTNAVLHGVSGEGRSLLYADSTRSAYTLFGSDTSSINLAAGSGNISIAGSPVGGTGNGFNMQPTVTDGAVIYNYSSLHDLSTTNMVQWQNHGTNFVAFHPGNIASTNTPIFISIDGTFLQVHVGAPDSGGTGLRALTVVN